MAEDKKNEKVEVIKVTRKDGIVVYAEFSEENMEIAIEQRHLWSTLSVVMMNQGAIDKMVASVDAMAIFQPHLVEAEQPTKSD